MSTKVKSPENLPKKPGVYIMRDANDEIIYIGKAKNLINRVRSYFREKLDRPKTQILMSHFDSLEYIVTNSEKEALILEATLIKKNIVQGIMCSLRMIRDILMSKLQMRNILG